MPSFDANARLRKTVNVLQAMRKVGLLRTFLEPRKVLTEIAQDQLDLVEQHIRSAGGRSWQVMAPLTLRRRPQRRSTRHFFSRYEDELVEGFTLRIYGAGTYGEIVTTTRYARLHHEGSGRIPARPLLPGISERNRARDEALRRLRGTLQSALRG